jgi:hypothetical protein
VCVSWHTSGVKTFNDARTNGLTIGGTGPSDDTVQFPRVLNAVLGTKFNIISGYPGGNDVVLAMERGEVQGRCGWSWSSVKVAHRAWIDEKKINVLIQLSRAKHPDLPNVPLITDLATNEEQKQNSSSRARLWAGHSWRRRTSRPTVCERYAVRSWIP